MASPSFFPTPLHTIKTIFSNHPIIVNFRWSPTQTHIATWSFLFSSIVLYVLSAWLLYSTLRILRRFFPSFLVSLSVIPAVHSFITAVISAVIFLGMLLSTVVEIHENRWLWRRTGTANPIHWLLCFPLGTRPAGRVFFWSCAYYLSRFLHLFRTDLYILHHSSFRFPFFSLAHQTILLVSSFLWLEFSQSFQILAILLMTSLDTVVHGYRFWIFLGFPYAKFPFVVNCQVAAGLCNLICHLGVLLFHFSTGGCNGIGAWWFNSLLNCVVLVVSLLSSSDERSKQIGSAIN